MADRPSPSDQQIWLKAEHRRLSKLIVDLDEVIGEVESAPFLKRDAAARLGKYRENRERQQHAREAVEAEMQRIAAEAEGMAHHDELVGEVVEKGPADREPLRELLGC